MFDSFVSSLAVFGIAAIIIGILGTQLTQVADKIADASGWGEAIVGAIVLGGSTSLPGIITSVTAALHNHPQLAVSNAIGGIAAQTVFLAVADIFYRRANLEYAAASLTNLIQGTLLIILLAIVLIGTSIPDFSLVGIHPISLVLIAAYIFGIRLITSVKNNPMWGAKPIAEVNLAQSTQNSTSANLTKLWILFIILGLLTGLSGYFVATSAVAISTYSGLSETLVGSLFTAVATSLPELVTSIAAVRQGALNLAVANIIGGNSFDVLFVAFADIAYGGSSIYQQFATSQTFVVALAILMSGVLLLGLLRREKYGIGNIGFESVLILLLYFSGFSLIFFHVV